MKDTLLLSATGPAPSGGAGPSGGAIVYWINMTTDPPEETSSISKGDLADWLDSEYGIVEHCTSEKSADAYDPSDPDDTTETRLQDALSGDRCSDSALQIGLPTACAVGRRLGDSVTETVYVHWSNPDTIGENYTFRATSDISPSGPTRGGKTISVVIDFTDTDYTSIKRYADADDVADLWKDNPPEFLGNVLVGQAIVDRDTIGVGWSNGRITLTQPVSGRLTFLLPIQYDVWSVSIPGVIVGNKRNYTATAYAFSDFLTVPAEVELSNEIEDPAEGSDCDLCGGSTDPLGENTDGSTVVVNSSCQLRTDWEIRNKCDTSIIVDSGTTYTDTPCPSKRVRTVTYTTAGTPDSAKITEEEYTEECCTDNPEKRCIPECREITNTWAGGVPVQPSEESWRSRYPNSVVTFVRVRPPNGCGVRRDKFVAERCGCDGITKLVWAAANPTIIAPNGSVALEVTGGDPPGEPITWEITSGEEYTLTGGGQSYTGGRSVDLFAGAFPCGSAEIGVADSCSDVTGTVDHTGGLTLRTSNPTSINDDTIARFYKDNGVSPTTFTISGVSSSDVYFYNTANIQEITTTAASLLIRVRYGICSDIEFTLTVDDGCNTDSQSITAVANLPLTLRTSNPTLIKDDTVAGFYKDNGVSPTTFTISGVSSSDVYFNGTANIQEITTTVASIYIRVRPSAIGLSFDLTVNDGCNIDTQTVTTID
jgi:hypothetical protein